MQDGKMTRFETMLYLKSGIGLDYAAPVKQALLAGETNAMRIAHAKKLEAAKDWLAKRWVLHPANRVKKLAEPIEPYQWKPTVLRRGKK